MIIDSHAHYNHKAYSNTFRYLTYGTDGYALAEADRAQLLQTLQQSGVLCSVEPGVSLSSCWEVLQLSRDYPGRIFPAVGVHPTRAIGEKWQDRQILSDLAEDPSVIAIGETGLDYHYPRKEQHRSKQYLWFFYQLDLAKRRKLPVILHVRDAHEQALRILRWHPAKKWGGVIHCFYGNREIAGHYVRLGYHVGIGGALLQPEERSKDLKQAVAEIPLERILLETDAPFILPYCKDVLPPKLLRRTRNTSLILPAVAEEIARIKGIPTETVIRATAENAIKLFHLPIDS